MCVSVSVCLCVFVCVCVCVCVCTLRGRHPGAISPDLNSEICETLHAGGCHRFFLVGKSGQPPGSAPQLQYGCSAMGQLVLVVCRFIFLRLVSLHHIILHVSRDLHFVLCLLCVKDPISVVWFSTVPDVSILFTFVVLCGDVSGARPPPPGPRGALPPPPGPRGALPRELLPPPPGDVALRPADDRVQRVGRRERRHEEQLVVKLDLFSGVLQLSCVEEVGESVKAQVSQGRTRSKEPSCKRERHFVLPFTHKQGSPSPSLSHPLSVLAVCFLSVPLCSIPVCHFCPVSLPRGPEAFPSLSFLCLSLQLSASHSLSPAVLKFPLPFFPLSQLDL